MAPTGRDADGLDRPYRSLSRRHRHQRFFTGAPPPRSTMQRYVGLVIGWGM
jgi:hypothetical protein